MEVQVDRGSGCGCGGCLSLVASLGMSVVITGVVFAAISASRAGSDEAALAALNACAPVTEALGSPIVKSRLSMGCGESSSGGGSGQARWSMTVVGPRGRGTVTYQASYVGDQPWTVNSATVDVGDAAISAVPCPSSGSPDAPAPGGGKKGRPKRR